MDRVSININNVLGLGLGFEGVVRVRVRWCVAPAHEHGEGAHHLGG